MVIDAIRQAYADASGVNVSQITNKVAAMPKSFTVGGIVVAAGSIDVEGNPSVTDVEIGKVQTDAGEAVGPVAFTLEGQRVTINY